MRLMRALPVGIRGRGRLGSQYEGERRIRPGSGKSTPSIAGVNFNAAGIGLAALQTGDLKDNDSVQRVVSGLQAASTTLRSLQLLRQAKTTTIDAAGETLPFCF
jgi:hypothetical protein